MASREGYTEIVRLLLADERVDPSADNNYAIREFLIRIASFRDSFIIATLILYSPRLRPGGLISRDFKDRWIKWLSREYESALNDYIEIMNNTNEDNTLSLIALKSIAMEEASLEVRIVDSIREDFQNSLKHGDRFPPGLCKNVENYSTFLFLFVFCLCLFLFVFVCVYFFLSVFISFCVHL